MRQTVQAKPASWPHSLPLLSPYLGGQDTHTHAQPTCRGADTHPDGHADDGPTVHMGTQVGAQVNAWMDSTHGWTLTVHRRNPISSRHLVRVSKIQTCAVPLPALIALAHQVHKHPQTSTCPCWRCSSRPGHRDQRIQPARRVAARSRCHARGCQPCACSPQPLHPLPMYHPAAGPMRPHPASWANGSWAAITAFHRAQPSYAGALLGRSRRRAGHIKSHFAGCHVLHPRR